MSDLGKRWLLAKDFLSDPRIVDAMTLINKYSGNHSRVALLMDPELSTQVLIYLQKSNVFSLSNPSEDNILEPRLKSTIYNRNLFTDGDIIFIEKDVSGLLSIQKDVYERIQLDFSIEIVETTKTGLIAARLQSIND